MASLYVTQGDGVVRAQDVDSNFRCARTVSCPRHWLGLLHGFELHCDDHVVALPFSAQRLVAFLALRGWPTRRLQVATTLWPDSTEERSFANLRSALWRLRCEGCLLVDNSNSCLRLGSAVTVDYHEIAERARSLLDPSTQVGLDEIDEGCFTGDLLPDWYDEWLVTERERFRQLRLCALESAAERLISGGWHGRAIQAALMAVGEDPLRESAHRLLVRAHLAQGNQNEALLDYQRYREGLRTELQVDPSPLFDELISGIGRR